MALEQWCLWHLYEQAAKPDSLLEPRPLIWLIPVMYTTSMTVGTAWKPHWNYEKTLILQKIYLNNVTTHDINILE